MKRILSLLFLAIAINLPVSLFALTGEEAIAMLEAASFAHSENNARREVNAEIKDKALAYPAMLPIERNFTLKYKKTQTAWNKRKNLQDLQETAINNNATIREAYIYEEALSHKSGSLYQRTLFHFLFRWNFVHNLISDSTEKHQNRFELFDRYLHELTKLNAQDRRKKVMIDTKYDNFITQGILDTVANIKQFDKAKNDIINHPDFETKIVPALNFWVTNETFANPTEHRNLLVEAFGQEAYTRWQTEHPELLTTNKMLGIITLQLATTVLSPQPTERLTRYQHIFADIFSQDLPAELLKTEASSIKNLRAFHKKYLADIAKAEKKAAKAK
ncbi:hypothetical protein [Entomospira culicis]|uniref:Uncharacterized protein n=1 Tax=Entomospira culicis TaxID=2719989 RepID=A0A968GLR9_9SPIO|nr:hypothetical protein [Entomospira culicis]NIZ19923.1 hypothetical protein [Entomospira culicis]NIZ70120.1 hypothetical protein [Entomospira culicis]WDI38047.1 hypothetical protein PVA46_07865 [Entomospira culicis]WDI39670.1 hypothetical protein PVA47_07865 [Entomospira culicis]